MIGTISQLCSSSMYPLLRELSIGNHRNPPRPCLAICIDGINDFVYKTMEFELLSLILFDMKLARRERGVGSYVHKVYIYHP